MNRRRQKEMQKSKGSDATGRKRGECGVDREDNSEWFRTADAKADRRMYGPDYVGKYNQVMDNARLEGDDA
jgi:hypothetical protein